MEFLAELKRIINSGLSRSIILTGNIYDLFWDENTEEYVPILDLLKFQLVAEPKGNRCGLQHVTFELNNPIEMKDSTIIQEAWNAVHASERKRFHEHLADSSKNATYALELLRQMTELNRRSKRSKHNLIVMVEAADMLIPDAEISRMDIQDRRRVAVVYDWFSDPKFLNGGDTAIFLSESRSSLHHRIARLPQVVSVETPLPDIEERKRFLSSMDIKDNLDRYAEQTSGLSLHALRQLVLGGDMSPDKIAEKVEAYMVSQLGEGVVEFKRPIQKMKDVIGNHRVKKFMTEVVMPGFLEGKLSGAAVGGPIGGGKTFICEAMAAELGIPVITLKSIRSKWFGETDKIFERLQRLLVSFHRIVIFVDEADTQFGKIQGEGHATEKRLTGKIQAMMSDVMLKGKVIWFLMTARIHLLSPDIRRPGRMDIIIPILDPEGEDRDAFVDWVASAMSLREDEKEDAVANLETMIPDSASAAMFAMVRSLVKGQSDLDAAFKIVDDIVLPDIAEDRQYQTLQAKVNCTRKSLLYDWDALDHVNFKDEKKKWREQIQKLEQAGIG